MGARSSRNTTQNNRSDGHLLEYFRKSFIRGGGGTDAPAIQGLTATGSASTITITVTASFNELDVALFS